MTEEHSVWWHFWHGVYAQAMWKAITAFIGLILLGLFLWFLRLDVVPVVVHLEFVVPLTFLFWVAGVTFYGLFWVFMLYKSSIWLMMARRHIEEAEKKEAED